MQHACEGSSERGPWKKEIRSGRSITRRYQSNHPRSVYKKEKKSVDPRWIRRPVAAWPTCLLRLVQNGKLGTNLSSTPCTLQRWPSWSGVQTLFLLLIQFSGGIISGCFSVSTCGKWINDRNMSLKRRATNPLNLVSPHPLVTNKWPFEHWRCGN